LLTPPYAADIVTGVDAATCAVVMLNLADVVPAGTVTLAGTDAAADELCSVTIASPAGAGPFRVTVLSVVVAPAITETGDRTTDKTVSGATVRTAVLLTPPCAAEIVAAVEAATPVVVIVNLADVVPAGIVRLAGTTAAGDELWSVTTASPAGAGAFNVTVFKVVLMPATVDMGDSVKE
jgi:hypothetical protein